MTINTKYDEWLSKVSPERMGDVCLESAWDCGALEMLQVLIDTGYLHEDSMKDVLNDNKVLKHFSNLH